MSEKRHAIVGIDPGATFGIALVDLSGRRMALRSTPGGFSDAARIIEAHGTPSLVACDTNPAPEAALRLASYFSCRLFVPRQSVREEEKRLIARGAGTSNTHERDAYCAAVYAYRSYANKLRQIDALSELTDEEKGKVKHMLLRGVRVQDAFLMLAEQVKEPQAAAKLTHAVKTASPEEFRLRLESLARENANLRLSIERLEGEKASLLHKLRLLENGVRQSLLRDSEFRKLRHRLQQILEGRERRHGHSQPQPKMQPKVKDDAKKEAEGEEINNLGSTDVDLERMVKEYRKGRDRLM